MKKLLLSVLAFMSITTMQAKKNQKNLPLTPKEKQEQMLKSLAHQNPFFPSSKKTRSAMRLMAENTFTFDSGTFVLSDSTNYSYLPTNGYAYDPTADYFMTDNINDYYYNNYKNNYDVSEYLVDIGTGSVVPFITETKSFNTSNHYLLSSETIASAIFPLGQKTLYGYNTSNLKNFVHDSVDIPGFFSMNTKSYFTHNASNKVILVNVFQKDTTSGTFVEVEKDSIFYDANNNVSSIQIYSLVSGTTFSLARKLEYTYNANNKMLSEIISNWNGTSWDFSDKTEFTYNASNQLTNYTTSTWDGLVWNFGDKTDFSYSTGSYPASKLTSIYDATNTIWTEDTKEEYTYNANNQLFKVNTYTWNSSSWDTSDVYNYFYEAYSPEATQNIISKNIILNVYPNPANDFVNITLESNKAQTFFVEVLDINGSVLFHSEKINNSSFKKSLDISSYSKGVYFIAIKETNGNIISTSKFVK